MASAGVDGYSRQGVGIVRGDLVLVVPGVLGGLEDDGWLVSNLRPAGRAAISSSVFPENMGPQTTSIRPSPRPVCWSGECSSCGTMSLVI